MKLVTTREITTDECPWMGENIPEGTEVYGFTNQTYGCITPDGIAVSDVPGEYPFYEIPRNAVKEI